jgi:type IV secretion system protein VirB1
MNIAAGSFIFRQDYDAALAESKLGQGAIQAALSAYNTGNFASGLTNGYVARYDTSGGIDALAARPAAWMQHLAPAARIALRDYLYPRAVFK